MIVSQDLVTVLLLDRQDAQALLRLVEYGLHSIGRVNGGLRTTAEVDALLSELRSAANNLYPATVSAIGPASAPIGQHEITTAKAALQLGCSDRHVRRRCLMGSIAARRVGRNWLVDASSLPDAEDGDDERPDDQAHGPGNGGARPPDRGPGGSRRGTAA